MCCFSPVHPTGILSWLTRPEPLVVSGTRIFARLDRSAGAAVQWLAYSMSLATPSDVAMVLPIPAARHADDALSFVDLSGYPRLFDDLEALFPAERGALSLAALESEAPKAKSLVVHSVGSFEASYVPSLADFDRLDARFRIPEEVWNQRPEYRAFGFAVFKLKKGKQDIHPMAFHFETKEAGAIFFPTLHVHDGALHDRAAFDHSLYFQVPDGATGVPVGPGEDVASPEGHYVEAASRAIEEAVDVARAKGLVARGGLVSKWGMYGDLPNGDTRVRVDAAG